MIRFLVTLLLLCSAGLATAEEPARRGKPEDAPRQDFDPNRFQGNRVAMDGLFSDWSGLGEHTIDVLTAAEYEYDWSGMDDLSAVARVQHNEDTLYVHVRVRDNKLVAPTKKQSGDLVDLWFDMGRFTGKSDRFYQLSIDPSYILTQQPPDALWEAPRDLAKTGAGAVTTGGALTDDGYEIEVAIPFSELGPVPPVLDPLGFCIVVRDMDQDDALEEEANMASCPFDWRASKRRSHEDLGRIMWDTRTRIWESVVSNLPALGETEPMRAFGQVGGDDRQEEVVAGAGQLVVMGLGLGSGEWYGFDLGFTQADDKLVKLELSDLDGDKDDEIVVVVRRTWSTGDDMVERDVLHVFDFSDGAEGAPLGISDPLLRAEVGLRTTDGSKFAEADVKLSSKGVTIKAGKSEGWGRDDWPAPEGGFQVDVPEVPVAWRKPKSRTFKRRGESFVEN